MWTTAKTGANRSRSLCEARRGGAVNVMSTAVGASPPETVTSEIEAATASGVPELLSGSSSIVRPSVPVPTVSPYVADAEAVHVILPSEDRGLSGPQTAGRGAAAKFWNTSQYPRSHGA